MGMNSRLTTILVIALLISGGATYLVYRVVSSRTARTAAPPTVQVVVAARQLEVGTLVKDVDVKMGPWVGPLPVGMVVKPEAIIGRGVIAPIYAGEAVMENRIAAAGAGGGLAATIPPGMRAVAVRVNDIVGVAGFVIPGMRVDVLISGMPPGTQGAAGANGPKVKTLLQNIQVLSAGQNYQKDAEGKPVVVPVVNLLVNPEQAEILSLASNETRIQLVLRNPLDTDTAKTPGTVVAALYGDKAAPLVGAAPRPRPIVRVAAHPPAEAPKVISLPPYQIEIFNGPQRSEAKFARRAEEK
jgi:pilus assembly protein CpaB